MDNLQPIIVAFVADLMSTTRIEDAARRAGYRVKWIKDVEQITAAGAEEITLRPAGQAVRPGDLVLERLTIWQPALLLFDLGNDDIPWRDWLALLQTSPATRRIPVICFGSRVQEEAMKTALTLGAQAALARGRIFRDLPDLIQKYARLPDYAAIQGACRQPLSALALEGLRLFNAGEYFEAHEALEEAWNEDQSAGRQLYQALLQVAVAYLQIERRNYNGAVKMFLRLRQWLDPLPEECRGVDIASLRRDVQAAYAHLVALGSQRMADFDPNLLKAIITQNL